MLHSLRQGSTPVLFMETEPILMAKLTLTVGYFTDLFVDIYSTLPDKGDAVCHKCINWVLHQCPV